MERKNNFFFVTVQTVFWTGILLSVFVAIVFFMLERGLPSSVINMLTDKITMEDFHLRVEHVSFSLHEGLHVAGVKLLPRRKQENAFFSVKDIFVEISFAPGIPLKNRLKRVTVVGARFPALPPKHKRNEPKTPPVIPDLPRIAPFELVLKDPDILGIHPDQLTGIASVHTRSLSVRDITIQWPDHNGGNRIEATLSLDFDTRLVLSHMKGQAYPRQIIPLLSPQALHAAPVVREINKFQEFDRPVDSEADLAIHIDTADFDLKLGVSAGPCTYSGVKMEYVRGTLQAFETNITTTVVIHPLHARSSTGPLSGRLLYSDDDNRVIFNVQAEMDLPQLFDIIGVLNEGELDAIHCKTPPLLQGSGLVCAAKKMWSVTNDAAGTISLKDSSILNFNLEKATGDLRFKGYTALFDNVNGTPRHGGHLSGKILFSFPEYSASQTVFEAKLNFKDVDLRDITHAVNITNEHLGKITGSAVLRSTTGKDALQKLCGEGNLHFSQGIITQIPLFAGFTSYLSKVVPGISSIVDQSTGSMSFTLTNGVMHTKNALIEGSVFSIKGRGSYDFVKDHLDFLVRANIFKQKTLVGKITHLVTFPFTKLLLEFKVFGPLEKTDWSYMNIIERISDSSLFSSSKEKEKNGETKTSQ